MWIFYFLILVIISAPFLFLFGLSALYFILGIRSFITGRTEHSRLKKTGGINAVLFSVLGMAGTYFLWRFFMRVLLDVEI